MNQIKTKRQCRFQTQKVRTLSIDRGDAPTFGGTASKFLGERDGRRKERFY